MDSLAWVLRCLAVAATLASPVFAQAPAQERLAELQAQFDHEGDPIRKAKSLAHLGNAQFEVARQQTAAGDFAGALGTFQGYRDDAKSASAALKGTGADAERKPGGYKQLQIHVRKGIREVEQTMVAAPAEEREGFESIRRDLVNVERELIDLLFPRQPAKNAKAKPKG
jgi:hypothetical protein